MSKRLVDSPVALTRLLYEFQMQQRVSSTQLQTSAAIGMIEVTPPIPPRTYSRLSIDQQLLSPLSILNPLEKSDPMNSTHSFFRLEDLPSPDQEWQLLENIGDGTYGEVFHVSCR